MLRTDPSVIQTYHEWQLWLSIPADGVTPYPVGTPWLREELACEEAAAIYATRPDVVIELEERETLSRRVGRHVLPRPTPDPGAARGAEGC